MAEARGRFIAFEGGEGVGKSTQAALLAERLRSDGREVVLTREPGGTAGAEAIRELLLHTTPPDGWTIEAEALLFAAARADHVARLIRPTLERGAWVVCDRFVGSSVAYQGVAGDLGTETVWRLHEIGSRGLRPDATLVLTLPGDEGGYRAAARDGAADAIGGRGEGYHRRVDDGFAGLAERDERTRLVDASGPPAVVADRVDALLGKMLGCKGRPPSSPARGGSSAKR